MDGDFRSDITRDTFDSRKHFSRVIRQQGRVDIDADWNELVDILLDYQRTLTVNLIGPHAGPSLFKGPGFAIHPWYPARKDQSKQTRERPLKESERLEKVSERPQQSEENAFRENSTPAAGTPPDYAIHQKPTGATIPVAAAHQHPAPYEFLIGKGCYYVDGILCECDRDDCTYTLKDRSQNDPRYLFYLDVWEREVTVLEDESISESALGGLDTATRSVVEWRVRAKKIKDIQVKDKQNGQAKDGTIFWPSQENYHPNQGEAFDREKCKERCGDDWTALIQSQGRELSRPTNLPMLRARSEKSEEKYTNPCTTPPSSLYRGAENQLYRIEIHRSGIAGESKEEVPQEPTFKWSRENGSVVFPIDGPVSGGTTVTVTVKGLGRDDSRFHLQSDDWVEIVDLEEGGEEPGPMYQVSAIDYNSGQVTLRPYSMKGGNAGLSGKDRMDQKHTYVLRRWDYQWGDPSRDDKGAIVLADDGAALVIENRWLTLEDGIEIQFHGSHDTKKPVMYQTGDYWLIPARAATGDIEWSHKSHGHEALPPQGVTHHYAPLALVKLEDGIIKESYDLRRQIKEGWEPVPG